MYSSCYCFRWHSVSLSFCHFCQTVSFIATCLARFPGQIRQYDQSAPAKISKTPLSDHRVSIYSPGGVISKKKKFIFSRLNHRKTENSFKKNKKKILYKPSSLYLFPTSFPIPLPQQKKHKIYILFYIKYKIDPFNLDINAPATNYIT